MGHQSVQWLGVVRRLGVLNHIRHELHREFGTDRLTGLGALAEIGGSDGYRLCELAERLHVDSSVVSRQVAHLESLGLVDRRRDPHDGRAFRLHATPAGTAWLNEVQSYVSSTLSERLQDWNQTEVDELARLLSELNRDFHAIEGRVS